MKVVFFGSSSFVVQVMEHLHQTGSLVAVVTTPDAPQGRNKTLTPTPVAQAAHSLDVPIYSFASLKNLEVQQQLTALNADFFVVASYGKIIPQNILDIPTFGSINIHPSLLPKYRGPTPMQTALLNGDTETGVSIIKMDAEVDHGPVLAATTSPIGANETFTVLAPRLFQLSLPLLDTALRNALDGADTGKEQDHSQASFTKMIVKNDGNVDWTQPAEHIYHQFRAYDEWPGIWTTWNGQTLKILDCKVASTPANRTAGMVNEKGIITCGNNTALQLTKVQLAGKQATDIQSFIRGYRSFPSSTLNQA